VRSSPFPGIRRRQITHQHGAAPQAQDGLDRRGGRITCSVEPSVESDMEKVDYDARLYAVYATGRQMSDDALQTWTETFARHLPARRPLVWLDLGSGTGRMTPSLASAFGGPAYGVEPSDRMRAQALAHARHPGVTYAAGSGEQIPLPDASCDAALLFFVWHHVVDREGTARELRRVVSRAASSSCRRTSPTGCLMSGGSALCPSGGNSTRHSSGPRKR
jgi:SAM-dependent methyltransferase